MSVGWIVERWDWRTSARWRLGSLASIWLLILGGPLLGALVPLLVAVRFIASPAQLLLNRALAARHPLEGRTRADWWLFGLTFLTACLASVLADALHQPHTGLVLVPVALPFSAIQLRAVRRSYRAHWSTLQPRLLSFPVRAEEQSARAA